MNVTVEMVARTNALRWHAQPMCWKERTIIHRERHWIL